MELPEEIRQCFGGEPYINIGDETCCLFVPSSIFLMKVFVRYPALYMAMVEGVKCASMGYYSAGILAYSQLIKAFSIKEPSERHLVAHDLLKEAPSESQHMNVKKIFDDIAKKKMIDEYYRYKNKGGNYRVEFEKCWSDLRVKLTK